MKKRWIAVSLLLTMMISMGACGGADETMEDDLMKSAATVTDVAEVEPEALSEETDTGVTEQDAIDEGLFGMVLEDGTYVAPNGRMSFRLPEGFQKTDSDDVVDFVSAQYPLKADNLHFSTTENSGGLSFYTKEILESVYADNSAYQDVKVISVEDTEVGGMPAVKAVMTFVMEDTSITSTQVYIEYGDLIYHIYYSKISDLTVDFDACLASVLFYE